MNRSDRAADLAMIWKQTGAVFPYFDRNRLDWDQAFREYLPKVMEAGSDREFHLLLAEFMNLLGDGHTDYQFPKALMEENGFLPFTLRFIRGGYCIDAVIPAYQDFLHAQVRSVNGISFDAMIRQTARYGYHVGDYVSRYRLHQLLPFFLKKQGNCMETDQGSFRFDLLPSRPDNLVSRMPALPESYSPVGEGKLDIRLYAGNLLYVKLDDFLYSGAGEELRTAILSMPKLDGLLLDLRENVGGMTMNGAKIAQLLIPGQFHGCQKRTRSMTGIALASASQIVQWSEDAIEKHIAAGYTTREEIVDSKRYIARTHYDTYTDTYGAENQRALYSGPCVILTSRHTVSAAEDFIAMFRASHRATVIGTETCGTTGTPLMQKLSCGGWMRVCSVGYRLLDGTEFVACGIRPDIYCETTVEDLQNGFDTVLKKGLEHLKAQI